MKARVTDEEIEQLLEPENEDLSARLTGDGNVIGSKANDFRLFDQTGMECRLSEAYRRAPVLLAFYPSDFTVICTKQLCNYRDSMEAFARYDLQIFGISPNSVEKHSKFVQAYSFPFRLLADEGGRVAKAYGCASIWMMSRASRAVFILNKSGVILYRYVEPTVLTRRSAKELLNVLQELRRLQLL